MPLADGPVGATTGELRFDEQAPLHRPGLQGHRTDAKPKYTCPGPTKLMMSSFDLRLRQRTHSRFLGLAGLVYGLDRHAQVFRTGLPLGLGPGDLPPRYADPVVRWAVRHRYRTVVALRLDDLRDP